MIKKADIVLSAVLILFALASVGFFTAFKKDGGTVRITVENEQYGEYRLDTDREIVLAHNTVEIKNRQVWVVHADCRDQICVEKGKISAKGESIVCLPNGVVVEVE